MTTGSAEVETLGAIVGELMEGAIVQVEEESSGAAANHGCGRRLRP